MALIEQGIKEIYIREEWQPIECTLAYTSYSRGSSSAGTLITQYTAEYDGTYTFTVDASWTGTGYGIVYTAVNGTTSSNRVYSKTTYTYEITMSTGDVFAVSGESTGGYTMTLSNMTLYLTSQG